MVETSDLESLIQSLQEIFDRALQSGDLEVASLAANSLLFLGIDP